MCIVQIEGRNNFVPSCVQKCEDNMEVFTHTNDVIEARKTILDLILSNHNKKCLTCIRDGNCELQDLARKYDMDKILYEGEILDRIIDDKSPSIVRDQSKCVLCRRCVATCKNIQDIGAIDSCQRGFESTISTALNCSLNDSNCTFCGQCIQNCPVGALYEKDNTKEVEDILENKDIIKIVQTAPAVRVALGEEFGLQIGTNVKGKMVTALKRLGFDKVFDTNTGADFTIMEEANEFVDRLTNNKNLPMFTSCCPAWVRFIEKNYPDMTKHLSSCKSPHQMFGAVLKSYYAKKNNISPDRIKVISVMPCVAKKFEAKREEMEEDDRRDVDVVITTRELARLIKRHNIDFVNLEDSLFDNPMGEATGAAAIFGVTGGVMEAALRTAADLIEGKDIKNIEYEQVRGQNGIKKATVEINDKKIKIAVASGLSNARKIIEEIKNKKADYQFVEIMACPGGCIMGGGQPIVKSSIKNYINVQKLRADSLYSIDEKSVYRKSHQNKEVIQAYVDYLEKPGSEKAHKYLHTKYFKRKKYEI